MKFVIKLVLLAAAGWSGYWFVGAKGQENLVAGFLDSSRSDGWVARTGDYTVTGFPNRFDTQVTDLTLLDPSGEWGWQADEFQIMALSYQPNHVIVAFPGQQVITTPSGTLSVAGEQLRGSVVIAPQSDLALSRLQLEGALVRLHSSDGWDALVNSLNIALHLDDAGADLPYRLGVEATDITPPAMLTSIIGGGQFLPDTVEKLYLDAHLALSAPLDRHSFETRPPLPTAVTINDAEIVWGSSRLRVNGMLRDSGGRYVEGELTLNVENWQPLFDVFKAASHLSTTEKLTLKRALDAASSGSTLQFTLTFSGGESHIGPFTIGPAPVIPF